VAQWTPAADDRAVASDAANPAKPALCFVIGEELAGQRIDHALSALAGVPRAQVKRWIEAGCVQLDGASVQRASRKLKEGDAIEAQPPEPVEASIEPAAIALVVLYEDPDLIVIDKPAGLVVHPGPGHPCGTLVNALLHHCGDLAGIGGVLRPGIVHRLDRGTSGVIVAAKTDAAHHGLAEQFHDHSIERVYQAFVRALPSKHEGRVDRPIGRHPRDRKRMSVRSRSGRAAQTGWRVLERFPRHQLSHLSIRPETGRTHQIRVHLAAVGMPIAGDDVYGRARRSRGPLRGLLDRPALHAAVLGFVHPRSGEKLRFEAALPPDLAGLQRVLRSVEQGSDQ
jgi:23S rRNA pseudouridine1911/1915/1917 synthase